MGKFYVDENNQARINCQKCGLNKNLDVRKFRDTHKRLKAKCRCGEVFRLTLDFRRHYRKNVRLAGEYVVQEKNEKGEVLIEDISMTGIRFATLKPHNISNDDTVELKFTLDNPMRTKVQEPVKIIRTIDRNVGAQYINQSRMQRIWFFV
ncbi:MAG: PilZ domain-containing protein [Desulfobulbia bacterium]